MAMQVEPFTMEGAVADAPAAAGPNWLTNARVLWLHRGLLLRVAGIALVANFGLVFLIPKQYESTARIMPPERSGSEATMFAAMAGRALGGDTLGGLAASLLGTRNSGALFVDLLRSGSVTGHIIDRFQLVKVYRTDYRVDAAKLLARRTAIVQDKKSGVIAITVTDTDAVRARDMAQAYLDELNVLVNRTSTSSAHQERVFIEHRLDAVKRDLERAQLAMSDFSSTHSTIDIREQTRTMVDAAAKLEAELVVTQGELKSLQQFYGDNNVRVRAAEARLANLKGEMGKLGGSSAELPADSDRVAESDRAPGGGASATDPDPISYPPLRQLPRLAVPHANLYRTVRVQENIFELLTQQYEVARLQEAKDIPVVSVIDAPGIPEKKSFPRRKLLTLIMTMIVVGITSAWLIFRYHWNNLSVQDPRRVFARDVFETLNPKRIWIWGFRRRLA
jgi:capsule polysaccharide export protein KpsE/RkpR